MNPFQRKRTQSEAFNRNSQHSAEKHEEPYFSEYDFDGMLINEMGEVENNRHEEEGVKSLLMTRIDSLEENSSYQWNKLKELESKQDGYEERLSSLENKLGDVWASDSLEQRGFDSFENRISILERSIDSSSDNRVGSPIGLGIPSPTSSSDIMETDAVPRRSQKKVRRQEEWPFGKSSDGKFVCECGRSMGNKGSAIRHLDSCKRLSWDY